jgi:hypothetical protein
MVEVPESSLIEVAWLGYEVQQALLPSDRLPKFRDRPLPYGACYVASETLYYLAREAGIPLLPYGIVHEGVSHWFLRTEDGTVFDLTAAQFSTPVPYDEGKRRAFLTREPSARAKVLLDRVRPRIERAFPA